MDFKSTVQNSLAWRVFHFLNYVTGGVTFLVGSFIYYPFFMNFMDSFTIAGWLYTIGSLGFVIADFTQWNFYRKGCLPWISHQATFIQNFHINQLGINFFASFTGSCLYLLGSIFFIPSTNQLENGQTLFIIGSTFIFLSQTWKCIRTMNGEKSIKQNIKQELSGFLVDLFAGIGGIFYFIGTIVFQMVESQPNLYNSAVTLFTIGGLNFFISSLFIFYRYFLERKLPQQQFVEYQSERQTTEPSKQEGQDNFSIQQSNQMFNKDELKQAANNQQKEQNKIH